MWSINSPGALMVSLSSRCTAAAGGSPLPSKHSAIVFTRCLHCWLHNAHSGNGIGVGLDDSQRQGLGGRPLIRRRDSPRMQSFGHQRCSTGRSPISKSSLLGRLAAWRRVKVLPLRTCASAQPTRVGTFCEIQIPTDRDHVSHLELRDSAKIRRAHLFISATRALLPSFPNNAHSQGTRRGSVARPHLRWGCTQRSTQRSFPHARRNPTPRTESSKKHVFRSVRERKIIFECGKRRASFPASYVIGRGR